MQQNGMILHGSDAANGLYYVAMYTPKFLW